MRYIRMPSTDLVPSALCMGGGPLSVEGDASVAHALLDLYCELGGTFIDSANVYGKWLPRGENACDRVVGEWLRTRGVRDRMIVASKGAHPPLGHPLDVRMSRAEIERDLDESLRALGIERIDLYYLHRDDERVPVERIIEDMNGFVRQGKIRYFAASNWRAPRLRAAQEYAKAAGCMGFVADQLLWNVAAPVREKVGDPLIVTMDEQLLAFHTQTGMAAVAFESQARGILHKWQRGQSVENAKYDDPRCRERARRAYALSERLGEPLTRIVLGYVLGHAFASYAILGCHTPEQLRDSMSAADFTLDEAQIRYLDTGEGM